MLKRCDTLTVPQSSTLPSLSAVTSRLSLSLSTLQSSHSLDAASLSHFTHERQDLDKQESELRTEAEKVEKKSRWFREFKETVEDWAAFLDEKVSSTLRAISVSCESWGN